jgi:hypothetical protein
LSGLRQVGGSQQPFLQGEGGVGGEMNVHRVDCK